MVPSDAVKAGDWGRIETLCREARLLSLGFSLLHIGINPQCECCALDEARMFSAMLGMPFKEGNSSAFVGKSFEFMKAQGRGEKGTHRYRDALRRARSRVVLGLRHRRSGRDDKEKRRTHHGRLPRQRGCGLRGASEQEVERTKKAGGARKRRPAFLWPRAAVPPPLRAAFIIST